MSSIFYPYFVVLSSFVGFLCFALSFVFRSHTYMKKELLNRIFTTLQDIYPAAQTELHYSTPFQLLIAVVMSAQATDKQVNKVTSVLFDKIKWPSDVLVMGHESFEQAIKSIGLYKSKAKNIFRLSQMLVDQDPADVLVYKDPLIRQKVLAIAQQYGYYIPADVVRMQTFPGVGEKTAKVVAHVLYDMPVIAVDTHVHRVCNRLGIVKTKQPLQTSQQLEKAIPEEYKAIAHHTLILFGRYYCTARKPKCEGCPFASFCVYYKKIKK